MEYNRFILFTEIQAYELFRFMEEVTILSAK